MFVTDSSKWWLVVAVVLCGLSLIFDAPVAVFAAVFVGYALGVLFFSKHVMTGHE